MTALLQQPEPQMLKPPLVAVLADEPVRLWHDDVRKPPSGWLWARTNADAKLLLLHNEVSIISMDHDLGGHNLDPDAPDTWLYKGPSTAETGLALVDWMIAEQRVPQTVYIHSWNAPGALQMKMAFETKGYLTVYIRPYEAP